MVDEELFVPLTKNQIMTLFFLVGNFENNVNNFRTQIVNLFSNKENLEKFRELMKENGIGYEEFEKMWDGIVLTEFELKKIRNQLFDSFMQK